MHEPTTRRGHGKRYNRQNDAKIRAVRRLVHDAEHPEPINSHKYVTWY
jgi:hypothetical protein